MEQMFNFNMEDYEANTGGVVPKGTYLVQVEKSELETTKNGGQMIKIQFNIVGEQQNGRKLFEQYNIAHENPRVVQIGMGQIKSLILASGANIQMFSNPQQLIGLECLVNVKTYEDDYGEKNKITNYKKLGGDTPSNQAGPMQNNQAPPQNQNVNAQGANDKPLF